MKGAFRNIASVFLAVMVLLSTVSWTVEKHLCMGRVMDIALFSGSSGCGMEEAMIAFMDDDQMDGHCCADETFTVNGQDDLKLSTYDLDLEHQIFLVAFAKSFIDLYVPLEELPIPSEGYPPPLITRDIHILDQVFLI